LHGAIHDGFGLAFETWQVGPGFTYAGAIPILESPGNKFSGQFTGIYRNTFMRQ